MNYFGHESSLQIALAQDCLKYLKCALVGQNAVSSRWGHMEHE